MKEKKTMRHRFALGFFLGVIATLVMMVCIGLGIYFSQGSQALTLSQKSSQKIDYIKKLIDASYLGEVDEEAMESGLYEGMLSALGDPYTEYYTAEEYAALMEESSGQYYGIGAMVSQNIETNIMTVVTVFEDAPAHKAGMLEGDILYKVEGEDITAQKVDDVVKKLKGEKGTTVNVTVYRESIGDYVELSIVRDEVTVPTVEHQMIDKKNKIGYIEITQFDQITTEQFTVAVEDLQKKGMKSLIIDVRNNPGGMYDVVCAMLDQLLPEGVIVYTEDKYGNKTEEKSDADYLNIPIVVLQNEHSASASEIFAGAIQDYGVGTVIGTQSFGKGIVQTILPLSDGSAIKVTIQNYFTPKGNNIHGTGITPNVVVEDNVETEADEQLNAALEALKK